MGWYKIPTKKQVVSNPHNRGATWDELYGSWACDICHDPLKEGDHYYVMGPDQYRHVGCDSRFQIIGN